MERARFCPTAVNATWGNCERLLSDGVKSDRIGLGIGKRRAAMEQYVGLDVRASAWWIKRARPCGKASVRRHLRALPLSSPGEHPERPGSALRAGCYRPGTGTR